MKNLITLLALFIPFLLTAQTNIVWKGGTPGKETSWNEARNWDTPRIPSENDHVIIRAENNGHFSQPVISQKAHIAWVEIHAGSSLTVARTGQLIVDGEHTYSEGISIYGGKLESDGRIILKNIEPAFAAKLEPIRLNKKTSCDSPLHGYNFCAVPSDELR